MGEEAVRRRGGRLERPVWEEGPVRARAAIMQLCRAVEVTTDRRGECPLARPGHLVRHAAEHLRMTKLHLPQHHLTTTRHANTGGGQR